MNVHRRDGRTLRERRPASNCRSGQQDYDQIHQTIPHSVTPGLVRLLQRWIHVPVLQNLFQVRPYAQIRNMIGDG